MNQFNILRRFQFDNIKGTSIGSYLDHFQKVKQQRKITGIGFSRFLWFNKTGNQTVIFLLEYLEVIHCRILCSILTSCQLFDFLPSSLRTTKTQKHSWWKSSPPVFDTKFLRQYLRVTRHIPGRTGGGNSKTDKPYSSLKNNQTSWWFQPPLKHMVVKLDHLPRGEKSNMYLKPPPSLGTSLILTP